MPNIHKRYQNSRQSHHSGWAGVKWGCSVNHNFMISVTKTNLLSYPSHTVYNFVFIVPGMCFSIMLAIVRRKSVNMLLLLCDGVMACSVAVVSRCAAAGGDCSLPRRESAEITSDIQTEWSRPFLSLLPEQWVMEWEEFRGSLQRCSLQTFVYFIAGHRESAHTVYKMCT